MEAYAGTDDPFKQCTRYQSLNFADGGEPPKPLYIRDSIIYLHLNDTVLHISSNDCTCRRHHTLLVLVVAKHKQHDRSDQANVRPREEGGKECPRGLLHLVSLPSHALAIPETLADRMALCQSQRFPDSRGDSGHYAGHASRWRRQVQTLNTGNLVLTCSRCYRARHALHRPHSRRPNDTA